MGEHVSESSDGLGGNPARPGHSGSPQVAVLFVPSLYRQGIAVALRVAGYDVSSPTDPQSWSAGATDATIVVVPDSEAALTFMDELNGRLPRLRSIALLERGTLPVYARALSRCTGAIPLDSDVDEVVHAVRAVQRSQTLLPLEITRELLARGAQAGRPPQLSQQELGWLRALAANRTVAGLARASGRSEREMYRHLASIYKKLGTDTRVEALLRAERLGMLGPERTTSPSMTMNVTDGAADGGARRPVAPPMRCV